MNVMSINAKCYQFCAEKKNWMERGNGLLRLNDEDGGGDASNFSNSRLIMRGNATHRLILNTPLWSTMSLDKAGKKAIRLSAKHFENGEVYIYLVKTANEKDITSLYHAIEFRIRDLKLKNPEPAKNDSLDSTGSSTNEKFEKDCKVQN